MSDFDDIEPRLTPEERHREERRAVEEAGGGEAEGFEQAEADLIDHASHGDQHGTSRITQDAGHLDEEATNVDYGEADDEQPGD
jgi:hypothetical protein